MSYAKFLVKNFRLTRVFAVDSWRPVMVHFSSCGVSQNPFVFC